MHFAERNYEEALIYFKKVLKMKPDLPAHARLGMAYSFYYLGKYTLAHYTFKRILQLVS
jgi:tetratricopeptide (TPR) repeat protein